MQKLRGFTLIELLVTIAVAAILVRLAAPSFASIIRSSNMKSTVNTFLSDLRFARSEAIRRGSVIVMCRSDSPEATTPTCATASTPGWETGWIIFQDLNNSSDYTAGEPLLRVQSAIQSVNSISESSGPTKFKFTATGQLKTAPTSPFTFGSTPLFDTAAQRTVCVNLGGRGQIKGDGSVTTCP